MASSRSRTLLVISQVYIPDPASVGQHMADAAAEMANRGWRVIVLASRDGYDDPSIRYPASEVRDGVEIHRLPWCSFGKMSILIRLLGGFSFVLQAVLRGIWLGPLDRVLVSTAPPMASLAALAIGRLRGAMIKFWVMDLNPDQMVALGRLRSDALSVRLLDWLNNRTLANASDVVVPDRFMAARINGKRDVSSKLHIIPPWPLDDFLEPVEHAVNPFRTEHGLDGKCVVMYSGNHGPTNPFSTILAAAGRLQLESRLVFVFIGGGVGKREIERAGLRNVLSLPYQPLETLRYSLSAADVHLVTMGDDLVGIVHPCKVYGAMAVARPVLFLGPEASHVGDLLKREQWGWMIHHNDVDGAVLLLNQLADMPASERHTRGERACAMARADFSKALLCGRFCDVLERAT